MSRIQVLVASDSALLREGIQALLSTCPDVEIVGKTTAGDEAIAEARRLRPLVVILDVPKPNHAPLQLLSRLKAELPELKVVIVTYDQDEASILRLLQMGAQGYLCGHEGATELITAVQTVAEGDSFLCPAASGALVRHYRQKAAVAN